MKDKRTVMNITPAVNTIRSTVSECVLLVITPKSVFSKSSPWARLVDCVKYFIVFLRFAEERPNRDERRTRQIAEGPPLVETVICIDEGSEPGLVKD